MDKSPIEYMKENTPTVGDMKESSLNIMDSINQSIDETKDGLKSSLNDFSNKSVVDAGRDFLESNSILAKFAFLIIVFIVFMVIFKIMVSILGYFLSPSRSPYIIRGALGGNENEQITQDPKKEDSIVVLKSNDRHRGIEFTWSTWLYLNEIEDATQDASYNPIFVKGTDSYDDNTKIRIVNGPGVYVKKDTSNNIAHQNLHIFMDHVGEIAVSGTNAGRDEIIVKKLPLKKWFHLAIRMQNMVMDIYVNGTIVKRQNMDKIPKQNYHDIFAAIDFKGKLSNLRYYDRALNVFEINNIVMFGPDTNPSERSIDRSGTSGTYSYISSSWYNAGYQ